MDALVAFVSVGVGIFNRSVASVAVHKLPPYAFMFDASLAQMYHVAERGEVPGQCCLVMG